jgi:hypothetical protein
MENIELKIDGREIDLTSCPPNKDHMSCYLTGEEIDQRAKCAYCWLTRELESYHIDAPIGRLRRKS